MILDSVLRQVVRVGNLRIINHKGKEFCYGPGGSPSVTVRFHKRWTMWRMILSPSLALGEAYMNGDITIERGSLYTFLDLCTRYNNELRNTWLIRVRNILDLIARGFSRSNSIARSKTNVAHHYDLSSDFYELFLDKDRQYSCAYFPTGKETLEEAQLKKKNHLMDKLLLRPEQTVLDIGSGWGGLSLHIAKQAKAHVTGITLSEEQLIYAQQQALHKGLKDQVNFALRDYRQETGSYDRIVSVGMFEHVGIDNYDTYFQTIKRLLKPGGVAVLHSIGRIDKPGNNDPWINKYIFPGSYAPALSEVLASIEKTGLWICDIEVWRLHYAETLRHWRERFMANWKKISSLYDERFCRMWEFYLASCEIGFRNMNLMVFQIQLSHQRDAVPLSRDYLYQDKEPYNKFSIAS